MYFFDTEKVRPETLSHSGFLGIRGIKYFSVSKLMITKFIVFPQGLSNMGTSKN